MTNAMIWAMTREYYLELSEDVYDGHVLVEELGLKNVLKKHAPTFVPDSKLGDSGSVLFADCSKIYYDWDEGDFEVEGMKLRYPYGNDDPLYWGKDEG